MISPQSLMSNFCTPIFMHQCDQLLHIHIAAAENNDDVVTDERRFFV